MFVFLSRNPQMLNPIPILWRNLLSFILWIFFKIIEKKINKYSFSMDMLEEEAWNKLPSQMYISVCITWGNKKRTDFRVWRIYSTCTPGYGKACFSVRCLWKPFLFLAQTLQCRLLFVLGVMNAKLLPHNCFFFFPSYG